MAPLISGVTLKRGASAVSAAYFRGASLLGGKTGVALLRMGTGASATDLTVNYQSVEQKPFDYAFTGLRITLQNYSINAMTLDDVRVACAPTDLHNGVGLTWVRATKSGSTTIAVPAMTQGPGGTASNNRIPGVVTLDLMAINSVARSDTPGAPFLIQLRAKPAAGTQLRCAGGPISRTNGSKPYLNDRGYLFGWQQSVGDIVANPSASGISPANSTALGLIGQIEAVTGNALQFDMPCFGDSLTAGYSGTADASQCGWPNMVTYAMRTTGKVGGLANWAVGGMLQANFYTTMRTVIANSEKPKAVFFPAFSPNSGTSLQSQWDTQFAAFQAELAYITGLGIKCYVANAMPLNNLTAPQKTMLTNFNAAVASEIALYTSDKAQLWDFYTVINDPGNPGNMVAAYNDDNPHPTPAGQQALADYVSVQLGL